jgi:glutamate racemase
VIRFTLDIVDYLSQFPLKALVVACNTATAFALLSIRQRVKYPVLGVIEPGVRAAIRETRNGKIGVIGTQGTINSRAYQHALRLLNPKAEVYPLACPALAPLVERGLAGTSYAGKVVLVSLSPLIRTSIDTLILGCTHYPLLKDQIAQALDHKVKLIDSAQETALELSAILQHNNLLAEQRSTKHRFFTTGQAWLFQRIAQRCLGMDIDVEAVTL